MKNNKVRISMVIKLAGAFCAFLIGAGFCSGQEIMQYFTNYGLVESIGVIVINCVLGAWTAAAIMNIGNEYEDELGLNAYSVLCGKWFGKVLSWFIPVFMFLTLVIMISGCGSTFHQLFGFPQWVGGVFMAAATVIIVLLGLSKVIDSIGFIGPVIIALVTVVSVIALIKNGLNLEVYNSFITQRDGELSLAAKSWFMSGVLYALWNVVMCLPFMSAMGSKAINKKEVIYGAIVGNVLFSIAVLFLILAEVSQFPTLWNLSIPTLAIAKDIAPWVETVFAIVLVFAIFTTAVPLMWSTVARLAEEHSRKFVVLTFVIAILGVFGAMLPFETLINYIYPLIGWVGLIELLCIIWREVDMIYLKKTGKELPIFNKVIGSVKNENKESVK